MLHWNFVYLTVWSSPSRLCRTVEIPSEVSPKSFSHQRQEHWESLTDLWRAGWHAVEGGDKLDKVQVSIVILVKCGEYQAGNTGHTVWRQDQTEHLLHFRSLQSSLQPQGLKLSHFLVIFLWRMYLLNQLARHLTTGKAQGKGRWNIFLTLLFGQVTLSE